MPLCCPVMMRFSLAAALLGALLMPALAAPATYTVKPGDTLFSVAQASGSSVSALQRLNNLGDPALKVGQVLTVPGNAISAHKPSTPLTVKPPAPPSGVPRVVAGPVQGPHVWNSEPAATVASFVGWSPVINTASFGDALPLRTYLRGLAFDFQTFNNCGPSALSAVLGFYHVKLGQDVIQKTTRQGNAYMQVSAIAPELARFGLKTRAVRGGQLIQIKKLLALGIPVIVLQWYDRPGHINHFRVVRGYDDQAGLVWVSDSMVGPVSYLSYTDFDSLWNTQGRQMFPVYPAGYDAQVRTFL